jgi:hypothetical protein
MSILLLERSVSSAEKPLEVDIAAAIGEAFAKHVPAFDYSEMVIIYTQAKLTQDTTH